MIGLQWGDEAKGKLVDLLTDKAHGDGKKGPEKLDVKLDKKGIVNVVGAQVKGPCKSFKELYRWNEIGMDKRHVSKTAMNAESSRSHLVFSILVESTNKSTGATALGKLTLVDLAGSERQSETQATGERLKEAGIALLLERVEVEHLCRREGRDRVETGQHDEPLDGVPDKDGVVHGVRDVHRQGERLGGVGVEPRGARVVRVRARLAVLVSGHAGAHLAQHKVQLRR